jgi:hypothetical protein
MTRQMPSTFGGERGWERENGVYLTILSVSKSIENRITNSLTDWKGFGRKDHGQIKVLSQNLLERTEENQRKP